MTTLGRDANGQVIQVARPGATQSVPIEAAAQLSAAVGAGVTLVCLFSDQPAHIKISETADASTGDKPIPAETEVFIAITGGEKISVIRRGPDDGTLWITDSD